MGCVSSKNAGSGKSEDVGGAGSSKEVGVLAGSLLNRADANRISDAGETGLGNLYRYIEGEQVAAGWPSWLTNVAKEAIYGWVPLKAESYEKLEKIGQGTYSSVFKARDVDTGRIVALKKVRFDNFEPESVRFMAREILILRKLNHPNIVKFEGIITARLSSTIYLVFEYMDHDLAGLSSSPDIKFTEPQVKCYMQQLLSAIDHCHSHGIMHRDIKCSNLLVNNEGILKMADFGLANFYKPGQSQTLTSRVVTLWYRPPELLLGSNSYEETVDLWSVGCVFAELFLGKPVLRGRTEVEQIHKIFKLCGSPPDEYWRNTKLRHAAVFKPHQQYVNGLHESFDYLPENTFKLLETFLSLEPSKRGTAKSALSSEYFKSKPYACEPSSLPKYSPHKEIDAKSREEAYRRRIKGRELGSEVSRRPSRMQSTGQTDPSKSAGAEVKVLTMISNKKHSISINSTWLNETKKDCSREKGENRLFVDLQPMPTINLPTEDQYAKKQWEEVQAFSGPVSSSNASGLVWAMKPKANHSSNRSCSKSNSRNQVSVALDSSSVQQLKDILDLKVHANENSEDYEHSKDLKPCKLEEQAMLKKCGQFDNHDSIHGSADCHRQSMTKECYKRDTKLSKHQNMDYPNHSDRTAFSGLLLTQSCKVDELLEKHEQHMRKAVHKSWFRKVTGR